MVIKLIKTTILAGAILVITPDNSLNAQDTFSVSLETVTDMVLRNNHLLKVRRLQSEEKKNKVNEDRIKYLPTVALGGSYQYNTNLPSLAIYQGQFGQLPYGGVIIPLPASDEIIQMGNHNIYNAGITVYQPLTQIGKINAGVKVSQTELQIAKTEEAKAEIQIKQSVEKLYFGLLIVKKQLEEAEIKADLAKTKLNEVKNAFTAGKTTESIIYGLAANAADEEQNLLKLKIQYDDYEADLKQLAGIDPERVLSLLPIPDGNPSYEAIRIDTSLVEAMPVNNDLKLAWLSTSKADFSVRASRRSYLPDLGILGGYTYQEGSVIYPKNNTYFGASFKWNLQDVLTTRTVQLQRIYLRRQAEENLANTREQINKDIQKALRKLRQSEELIKVAGKVVEYRQEDLRIQKNKREAGLNLKSDLLTSEAALAKAEADFLAARLNYRIALSELKILTGNY